MLKGLNYGFSWVCLCLGRDLSISLKNIKNTITLSKVSILMVLYNVVMASMILTLFMIDHQWKANYFCNLYRTDFISISKLSFMVNPFSFQFVVVLHLILGTFLLHKDMQVQKITFQNFGFIDNLVQFLSILQTWFVTHNGFFHHMVFKSRNHRNHRKARYVDNLFWAIERG